MEIVVVRQKKELFPFVLRMSSAFPTASPTINDQEEDDHHLLLHPMSSSSRSTASTLRTTPASSTWSTSFSLSPANAASIQRLRSTPSSPSAVFDRLSHKAQAAVAIFIYEQPYFSSGDAVPTPIDWFPPNSRPNLAAPATSTTGGGEQRGEARVLHVVMTTRALHLRSHPGQASLPGGKRETSDPSIEHTAFRESMEEINMSGWNSLGKDVHWLHTAPPRKFHYPLLSLVARFADFKKKKKMFSQC